MSIKGTVWFHIGDPFFGFFFDPPLHLEWASRDSSVFRALKWAIMDAYKAIAPHPSTEWKRIAEASKPFNIEGRRVRLDIRTYWEDEFNEIVLMRACLPFKAWPFGGRVVIEGWRRTEAGAWTRLATEELEKEW